MLFRFSVRSLVLLWSAILEETSSGSRDWIGGKDIASVSQLLLVRANHPGVSLILLLGRHMCVRDRQKRVLLRVRSLCDLGGWRTCGRWRHQGIWELRHKLV